MELKSFYRKEKKMKKRGYTFPYFGENHKELKDIFDKWENTNEPLTYVEISKVMYVAREHMWEREASSWK